MKYLAFSKKKFYFIPFLFIINTIEVVLSVKNLLSAFDIEFINYRSIAAFSLILSTIAVLLLRFSETYKNGFHFYNVSIGLLSALFFNGLIVYPLLYSYFNIIPPGIYTWAVLIVPFTIYLFFKELKLVIKRKQIILSIILGPIFYYILSIGIFIFIKTLFNN